MSANSARSIGSAEGLTLLDAVLPGDAGNIVLAVSGGADSMALLALAAENRARFAAQGRRLLVVTVDHGLRPEARDEARLVADDTRRLGIAHRTGHWRPAPGHGNLSAAAREARYAFLIQAAHEFAAGAVLTAHHLGDQIETHMMARRRGEGVLRLAAMRPRRALAPGIDLCRPFLGLQKARLVASLDERGMRWSEDPTNRDPSYERIRLRNALAAMTDTERESILQEIAEANAGRAALERGVAAIARRAHVDERGTVICPRVDLGGPRETAAAFLSRALGAAGGAARRAPGACVRALSHRIAAGELFVATLGGCRIEAGPERILLAREFGRRGPPDAHPVPGRAVVFDERFDIDLPDAGQGRRLVPLGRFARGGAADATLPVLTDGEGRPLAAHPAALRRFSCGLPALASRERVSWRLSADLPAGGDVDQIVAKVSGPVGNEFAADYLAVIRV